MKAKTPNQRLAARAYAERATEPAARLVQLVTVTVHVWSDGTTTCYGSHLDMATRRLVTEAMTPVDLLTTSRTAARTALVLVAHEYAARGDGQGVLY